MKVNVEPLARAEVGEQLGFELEEADPHLPDVPVRGLRVTGTITQLGDRLLVAGTAAATGELACVRCLKPFESPLTAAFNDEFSTAPAEDQFEYAGDSVDLAPVVRAALLLAIPNRPLHDPDCRGLCPVCGKDLNAEPHDHPKPDSDHPFAALKDLGKR